MQRFLMELLLVNCMNEIPVAAAGTKCTGINKIVIDMMSIENCGDASR